MIIGLLCVTAGALGLRLFQLDAESLWMDELRQVGYYGLPLHRVVLGASDQAQAPLDYVLGAGLARVGLAGSDWWVRFPAAVFGAASVFLFGWWIARIAGTAAGVAAAALLAVCPLHVAMSQEARPYTIFLFLVLATTLLFDHARRRHTLFWWGSFSLSLLALLLARWIGPHFIALGLVAYSLGTWLVVRRRGEPSLRRVETRKQWAAFTAIVTAYCLYNPVCSLILFRMGKTCLRRDAMAWIDRLGHMLSDAYTAILCGYSPRTLSAVAGDGRLLIVAGVLAAAGLIMLLAMIRRGRDPVAVLFVTTLVVFPLVYAPFYTSFSVFRPKPQYLLPMALPLLGLIAITMDGVRRRMLRVHPAASMVSFAVLIGLIAVPMARASIRGLQTMEKRDWRGVLTFLGTHKSPDDAIAAVAPHCVPQHCTAPVYGVPRYGWDRARFLATELNHSLDRLAEEPWTQSDNTTWIIALTDVYEVATSLGYGLLPPPEETPPDVRVHRFANLFILEMRGDGSATERLMAGIDLLNRNLPDRRGFVAPNLFAGRYFLSAGEPTRADVRFDAALRQCRTDAERDTLVREYLPASVRRAGVSGRLDSLRTATVGERPRQGEALPLPHPDVHRDGSDQIRCADSEGLH